MWVLPPMRRSEPPAMEQPKKTDVPTEPGRKPPKPFMPSYTEQPIRHVYPVTLVHPETVVLTEEQSRSLTPVNQKPLTSVNQNAPEKINAKINDPPQNVNFPVKKPVHSFTQPPVKKLPKKMQFKGKKGRQRTEAEVIDLLTFVQARNGAWPNDNYVSEQMRRYYRREYPEYFRKARKGKKVQAHRPAPIDLQARRSGTGV